MKKSISKIVAAVLCMAVMITTSPFSVRAEGIDAKDSEYTVMVAEAEEEAEAATEAEKSDETEASEPGSEAGNETEIVSQEEEKLSFTEKIAAKFASSLGKYIPDWAIVLLVSMMPILELRAGLFVAKFLNFDLRVAIPICVIGNIIPIPFILLFIKKIFKWMGKTKLFHKLIEKLEARAMKKSSALSKGEFWGLVLFVGIPIPGTGAWMGSLIAALLEIDIKKAIAAELVGIVIATIIVSILSYGLLGIFI